MPGPSSSWPGELPPRPEPFSSRPVAASSPGVGPADLGAWLAAARAPSDDPGAIAARRALFRWSETRQVAQLVDSLLEEAAAGPPARRCEALLLLGQLGATRAFPTLLTGLRGRDAKLRAAAHEALVTLTRQDFGERIRRWERWWTGARHRHRIEWLLDALAHRRPDLRLGASQELEALCGVYVGYHFDLDRRDREEARRRLVAWWEHVGRPRPGARPTG